MIEKKTNIVGVGKSKYIRIPNAVFLDSVFPFKENAELSLRIERNKLVIEKTKGGKNK